MFSNLNRTAILEQINQSYFDIIVIGGGITGSGIALDAAARGLKVLLLDKGDFASGTSSKSTKLIHGGLRYLKGLEFSLVAEVGRERAVVFRNAMHLVYPEKMLLPIVKNGTLGKWATGLGLWLYDLLAHVHGTQKRVMLNKAETLQEEPCLREDVLLGGGLYYEYRTNDARLTVEVLKTAVLQHHAVALNYARVKQLLYQNKLIEGVEFVDETTRKIYTVYGQKIINAAGPWVDDLRTMDGSMHHKKVVHSKGVHIALPRAKLPLNHAVYFEVADKRMIFAIPAGEIVYVGTTDTFYTGNIDDPTIAAEDIAYLLNALPQIFNVRPLVQSDIVSAWSGVRPLIFEAGKKAGELSRHDEIFIAPSGLITIAGGKLTGYRLMAERVVDLCLKNMSRPFVAGTTRNMHLFAAGFENEEAMKTSLETCIKTYSAEGIPPKEIRDLFFTYGTETGSILQHHAETQLPLLLCALHYCIRNEMVLTLSDFIYRRTHYGVFAPQALSNKEIEELLRLIQQEFHLSDEAIAAQRAAYTAGLISNQLTPR